MKKLSFLLMGLLAFTFASCGSSYNENTCEDLIEKYEQKGKLSSDDYAEAIKQCNAILDDIDRQTDKVLSLVEDRNEKAIDLYEEIDEGTQFEQLRNLGAILERAYGNNELKNDTKQAYKDLEKKAKQTLKKLDKAETKVRKLKRRLDD